MELSAKEIEKRNNWSYFPIVNQKLEEYYQDQLKAFWTKGDLVFTESSDDISSLRPEEETLLHGVLSIFSQFDGLVGDKVDGFNDHEEVKKFKEATFFFRAQNLIETVHNEVYGLMLIHYIENEEKRNEITYATTRIPVVVKLANWIESQSSTDNLLKKIFINAITEGVMFQGLFAIIFWFRKTYKGKFLGLTTGNEMISRDEELHASFAMYFFIFLKNKFKNSGEHEDWVKWAEDRSEVVSLIEELMEILTEFYNYFLPNPVLDLNSENVIDYSKVWANILLMELEHNPRYDVENPLEYMDVTGMYRKKNFFEGKEVGYQKGLVHTPFKYDPHLLN